MPRPTVLAVVAGIGASGAIAQETSFFGGEADNAYAALLWNVMVAERLTGDKAIQTSPYDGADPHGFILQTIYTDVTVDGHTGALIIKRNYGPEGVEFDDVLNDPGQHLAAVTVMFQREVGYDGDNQDWFWVKYLPDGTLDKNPAGASLAGRVGKNADAGCIACHLAAGGDDYIFTTDASVAMMK